MYMHIYLTFEKTQVKICVTTIGKSVDIEPVRSQVFISLFLDKEVSLLSTRKSDTVTSNRN